MDALSFILSIGKLIITNGLYFVFWSHNLMLCQVARNGWSMKKGSCTLFEAQHNILWNYIYHLYCGGFSIKFKSEKGYIRYFYNTIYQTAMFNTYKENTEKLLKKAEI